MDRKGLDVRFTIIRERASNLIVTSRAAEETAKTKPTRDDGHGLVAGDLIINTTHSGARLEKVDANNITVAAIIGMTNGDTIETYKTQDSSTYTLNRIKRRTTPRVKGSKISGEYLP